MTTTIWPGQVSTAKPESQISHRNPDLAVVRRVQSGDSFAFRSLVERYQSPVYSALSAILQNRKDADEVSIRVFTRVHQTIRTFDLHNSLHSWIHGIMISECVGFLSPGSHTGAARRAN